MSRALVDGAVVLAACYLAARYARAWMAQTAHLKLSLFRPYVGDPWPIGVQEDDDFHFKWTPAEASPSEDVADGQDDGPLDGSTWTDLPGGSVPFERVGDIHVHRLHH